MDKKIKVDCPTCNQSQIWSTDNPSRPFCSERCKLIDLGEWANDSRSIAGNELEMDAFSDDLS